MKVLGLVAALFLSANNTNAGVEGGNTELFRPVNANGEQIEITFTSKHPYQDKLVEMIGRAELPVVLKSEMLADLAATSVMLSNEVVTYADTQKQIQMVLSKIVKTTSKDASGNVTETTQEEYTLAEAASKLGIYIVPVNYSVKDVTDTYVAAYTQSTPKRVVYFTEFLGQMTEEEAMTLVLHEQAHRLDYLKMFHDDERFIEGYSSAILGYLMGTSSKDEFYKILASNKLETLNVAGIPGERYEPKGDFFAGEINVTVSADQVVFRGLNKQKYILQVSKDVFKDYPVLQGQDYMEIGVESIDSNDRDLYAFIENYFSKTIDGIGTFSVPLHVSYKKLTTPDSNGRYYTRYSEQSVGISSKEAREAVEQAAESVAKQHSMSEPIVSGSVIALLDPDYIVEVYGVISRLNTALHQLRREIPTIYKMIAKNSKWLSIDIDSATSTAVSVDNKVGLALNLDTESLKKLTVRAIKEQLVKSASSEEYEGWLALREINTVMNKGHVIIAPNDQTVKQLKLLNDFLLESPELQARLKCMGRKVGDLVVNVQVSIGRTYWDYLPAKDSKVITLNLGVRGWLMRRQPLALEKLWLDHALAARGTKKAPHYSSQGVAKWNNDKELFTSIVPAQLHEELFTKVMKTLKTCGK